MHETLIRAARFVKQEVDKLGDRWYLLTGPEPPAEREPDFLIMGAMKAGTTSLHDCLAQHPDVYMTHVKEPSYYLNVPVPIARGEIKNKTALHKLMYKGFKNEKRVGESSTTYSEAPTVGVEAPANIHRIAPDMQFVYIVRNPLGRIVSHYLHCVELGLYSEPINEVLAKDKTFVERSLYGMQLNRYLELFKKEQFLLLFFEEFVKDPEHHLATVCRFLGVSEDPVSAINTRAKNKSIVSATIRANSKFDRATYARLMEPIEEDKKALEKFLGHEITLWDFSEEKWCRAD